MLSTATAVFVVILVAIVASWFLLPLAWAGFLLAIGRLRAGLHARTLEMDGREWFYLEGGSGPVLLALHGFGADADNWLFISRWLTRHFRVIAPDLPGFGRSMTDDPLGFDIDSQVDRLGELMRTLDVSPDFLVGNSMGGWIAASYAARHPEHVKALWLLAPLGVVGGPESPLVRAIDDGGQSPFEVSGTGEFEARVWQPMFGKAPWIPFPLKKYYARQAERLSGNARSMFRQVRDSSESLQSLAASVDAPVLLQWGDRDNAVDVTGAEALRRAFTNVTVEIQEGVGHLPMIETPAASVRLFKAFCSRRQLI